MRREEANTYHSEDVKLILEFSIDFPQRASLLGRKRSKTVFHQGSMSISLKTDAKVFKLFY